MGLFAFYRRLFLPLSESNTHTDAGHRFCQDSFPAAYRKSGYSKSFWKPTGRQSPYTRLQKLPKVKALDAKLAELLTKKNAAYPGYRKVRYFAYASATKCAEQVVAEEENTTK